MKSLYEKISAEKINRHNKNSFPFVEKVGIVYDLLRINQVIELHLPIQKLILRSNPNAINAVK